MIDTGAEVSVIPPTNSEKHHQNKFKLFAANGSIISTYGEKTLTVDLGLKRQFNWLFIIADVQKSIIGADFLKNFGLLADVRRGRLCDTITNIESIGKLSNTTSSQLTSISNSAQYHKLLEEFKDITKPALNAPSIKHNIKHFIETTGPPVYEKPRRLSPEKMLIAKHQFQVMMDQGICRPSKSPYASP